MVAMLHASAKLSKYLHISRKNRHMWIGGIRDKNEANGANGGGGKGGGAGGGHRIKPNTKYKK
jgi:hypothetical protein